VDEPIFIGFDGGGSTSRFILGRGKSEPKIFSFPLNLKYTDLGIENSAEGFAKCLKEILNGDVANIRAMCISLSGASHEKANNEFKETLQKKLFLPEFKVHIESDSTFTLQTAYPNGGSGLLLIAGTGSVVIAKKRNGDTIKIGGWGRLLGDEGSGYWIGLQALKYYCHVMDGIENNGDFFEQVQRKLHIEAGPDFALIRTKLYQNKIKPQDFTPIVFEFENDSFAGEIIRQASRMLMKSIENIWSKVEAQCDPVLTLHGQIAREKIINEYILNHSNALGLECKCLAEIKILHRALKIASELA